MATSPPTSPTSGARPKPSTPSTMGPQAQQEGQVRQLFWQNMCREMLVGLAVLCEQQPEQFDGRFAILTNHGERIPIAQIVPLFAMSVPSMVPGSGGTGPDAEMSRAVQCTVFRVLTPSGEVFTLPLHEIRALHTLTPQLIAQLEAQSEEVDADGDGVPEPFGFAAFTALPKHVREAASASPQSLPKVLRRHPSPRSERSVRA